MLIFTLVGVANIIDVQVIGTGSVLRTAVIFFYLSNEGVSLLENAAHLGLPIPKKLKDILEQLHDRIDVSSWQGNIDFAKVKASGIDFVIIRAGYGRETRQNDNCFELNYRNAKAAGLDVGAYWYSYADSAEDAVKEACACMEVIKGKKFEYPIYFDLEEQSQFAKGRNFCDSVIKAFCGELEKNGYLAGLYCSTYYLNNYNDR